MRSLGQFPDQEEIEEMVDDADEDARYKTKKIRKKLENFGEKAWKISEKKKLENGKKGKLSEKIRNLHEKKKADFSLLFLVEASIFKNLSS